MEMNENTIIWQVRSEEFHSLINITDALNMICSVIVDEPKKIKKFDAAKSKEISSMSDQVLWRQRLSRQLCKA